MRLTCPNCDAQYEVPDEVVPQEGRDVQCSNCGQTWFQHHVDRQPDLSQETDVEAEAEAVRDMLSDAEDADPDDEFSPPPPPPAAPEDTPDAPQRQDLDPAVTDILREEAAAEQAARRQRPSDPLESQPDLGLDDSDALDEDSRRAMEARKRMARMRGEPDPTAEAEASAAALSSRRDLLPDIEEINSTLRNDEERATSDEEEQRLEGGTTRKRRRGFRRGLFLMLLIFVLLLLLYIFAPRIAQAVPQLDPFLSSYVTWVDQLRMWLDGRVRGIAEWLDSAASKSSGN